LSQDIFAAVFCQSPPKYFISPAGISAYSSSKLILSFAFLAINGGRVTLVDGYPLLNAALLLYSSNPTWINIASAGNCHP
jgi:hypothetical protein